MSEPQAREQVQAEPLFNIEINHKPGDPFEEYFPITLTNIPIKLVWNIFEIVREVGIDRVRELLQFAADFFGRIEDHGIEDPAARVYAFFRLWEGMEENLAGLQPKAQGREDYVLQLSYSLVAEQGLTYTDAARIANVLLETDYSPDAWRLRLTRWASDHGLPPLAVKRGRPPSKKSDE